MPTRDLNQLLDCIAEVEGLQTFSYSNDLDSRALDLVEEQVMCHDVTVMLHSMASKARAHHNTHNTSSAFGISVFAQACDQNSAKDELISSLG